MEPLDYRRLMGYWATGVSVVTSLGADGPRGATANALSSLSLEPPLLLVCFDVTARTLTAVRDSRLFCVNVLSVEQEELSRRFTLKVPMEEKFAQLAYRVEDGVPVLEDCLATVVCSVEQEMVVGDHAIVVGAPRRAETRPDLHPLLFYRGGYWERIAELSETGVRPGSDFPLRGQR